MHTARRIPWISPQEYLESELVSEVRHEYFAGEVFAMAGASVEHNRIALNIASALHAHLSGKKCEAFMNDMKAHLEREKDEWFYYPDVMVNCEPAGQHKYYCDTPAIIFEVLSEITAALDRREKRMAYQSIASLRTYVLVDQERCHVTIYRRTPSEWTHEVFTVTGTAQLTPDHAVDLPEIEFRLPLNTIYERVPV
jgi:Uma2 family endonuclease